ncbi:hypothetical protein RBSWK_00834 [Rhodopirellula baltica SWK14]|uniref:Uncharacterized protein n=1 Tax=Rhodopirellula baltica SWK14 TaxID=993516 RepID=L7CQ21_RHOBT|nr:hypothetical protein RBSWK_00834 [Rhodopirellula baltica SWK14]
MSRPFADNFKSMRRKSLRIHPPNARRSKNSWLWNLYFLRNSTMRSCDA